MPNIPKKFLSSVKRIWRIKKFYPTGIPMLDGILGGGLPEKSFVLVAGDEDAGRRDLIHKFRHHFMRRNRFTGDMLAWNENYPYTGDEDWIQLSKKAVWTEFYTKITLENLVKYAADPERKFSIHGSRKAKHTKYFDIILLMKNLGDKTSLMEIWKRAKSTDGWNFFDDFEIKGKIKVKFDEYCNLTCLPYSS